MMTPQTVWEKRPEMNDQSGSTLDLCSVSAANLLDLYEWKTVSPIEATKAVFKRISEVDDKVNAFSHLNEEAALKSAAESEARWLRGEARGIVDGIPVTVKDIVKSKDWPMLKGSKTGDPDQELDEDSPVVARLREHGAIFIGRTTTPEIGWKGVTDSPLTGITRNPWDTSKTAGGSSGGAAAAAALGMGALHIGSDGGGSVRIPAGFCGIFSFKPTSGRVPVYPASVFGTLSHLGPMTRTVDDAALMMNVLIEPDSRDWYSLPYDPWNYRTGLDLGVRRLRIGVSIDLGYADVDPEIAAAVKDAAKVFEGLGATVEEVAPIFDSPLDCFNKHWYMGCRQAVDGLSDEQKALMDPGLIDLVNDANKITLDDYLAAMDERVMLGQTTNKFHEDYDLLLTPTLPIPAFDADLQVADPATQNRWPDWTPFSYPFNLTGQPACSAPCGFTKSGLPIGLQIVGPRYSDPLVIRAAAAFESERPFVMPSGPDPKG
jgi:aspartyl-tRNA(Asn)/glutamyl-tRNA(Gln) amidotransferase subunit A